MTTVITATYLLHVLALLAFLCAAAGGWARLEPGALAGLMALGLALWMLSLLV